MSIAILPRYWKCIWSVSLQTHQEGGQSFPAPCKVWGALLSLKNIYLLYVWQALMWHAPFTAVNNRAIQLQTAWYKNWYCHVTILGGIVAPRYTETSSSRWYSRYLLRYRTTLLHTISCKIRSLFAEIYCKFLVYTPSPNGYKLVYDAVSTKESRETPNTARITKCKQATAMVH